MGGRAQKKSSVAVLIASSIPTSAADMAGSTITPCSSGCDAQKMSICACARTRTHTSRGRAAASRSASTARVHVAASRGCILVGEAQRATKGRGDCGHAATRAGAGRAAHPDKARRAVLLERGEGALDRVEHVAQLGARPAVGEERRRRADHPVEARGAVRLAHERLGQREARRLAQLARALVEAGLVDDVLHHLVHRVDALEEGAQPGEADPADAPLAGGEPLLGGEDGQGDALPRGGELVEQMDRQLLQLLLLLRGERRFASVVVVHWGEVQS